MRHLILLLTAMLGFTSPLLLAQTADSEHVEVGVFADYLRLCSVNPTINFVGLGGRAGFNVSHNVQIEGEISYDFSRAFASTFSNGVTSTFVQTRVRPLTGLFGPKFQVGSGAFTAFATFKAGFENFSTTTQNAPAGFTGSFGGVTSGDTRAAIYPGGGVEGFWGPFGLRLDVGDDIYFDNGAHNNLKVTFGPAFRF